MDCESLLLAKNGLSESQAVSSGLIPEADVGGVAGWPEFRYGERDGALIVENMDSNIAISKPADDIVWLHVLAGAPSNGQAGFPSVVIG